VAKRHGNWLGVHLGTDKTTAAVVTPAGANGKPCVRACGAFHGDTATAQLLQWHKGLVRGQRGMPNLLLQAQDYQVMDMPPVAMEERREALRWRLRDVIDFPAEEAALDCIEIPATSPGEASTKLLTLVSKRDIVGRWMQRFQDGGQPLTAIDIPELALRNVALLAGQDTAHAYLHVGLETTRLLMLWQRELCAFRQLDIHASQWANADPVDRTDLSDRLALEIQRSADAFARQYNVADFTNLWVSGAGDVQDLCDALTPLVTMPVQALRLTDWLDWSASDEVANLGQRIDYTLAVGAALRSEATA
jgi:MSHA biogenesis protein MshI